MRTSQKSSIYNLSLYHIQGSVLDEAATYNYLGVELTTNLSWQTHVKYVVKNANRTLG